MRHLPQRILSLLVLPCVFAAMFLPGCEEGQTAIDSPAAGLTEQEGVILAAVEALAARGDGASTTVTDADGTPYLKLAVNGGGIVAALPLSWLQDDQQRHAAARELFADSGASGSSELPDFGSSEMFPEFSVSLGDAPDYAAHFTADVLEQVYAVAPQAELIFETEDD